jgi:spermidine/putrescine transport system substrate-binding protein
MRLGRDQERTGSPVRGLAVPGPSRRTFLQAAGFAGLAALGSSALGGCGSDPATVPPQAEAQTDELVVSNWPAYVDVRRAHGHRVHPTIEAFQRRTGVRVRYHEDVTDNARFLSGVRDELAGGKPTGRDLFMLTDWMAAKLIRLGWLEPVDHGAVPNATNLIRPLRSPAFDPERTYSLPWQSGMTGIATNRRVVDRDVRSMTELLLDPSLHGRVTVLTEMRDTMGLLLLDMGSDPADFTSDEWGRALEVLQRAVDTGQIRGFTGNEYLKALRSGDIAACVAWSGDIMQAQLEDPKITFALPAAGAMLWSDNMLIPNAAANVRNATAWMNYYYDPVVAARVAAWVQYISPVQGAREAMTRIAPDLVDNPLVFPDDEDYRRLTIFRGLTEEEETEYAAQFTAVAAA